MFCFFNHGQEPGVLHGIEIAQDLRIAWKIIFNKLFSGAPFIFFECFYYGVQFTMSLNVPRALQGSVTSRI